MIGRSSHPAAPWAYRTASELAAAVRERRVSAFELTEAFIARIEALDGDLNAVPVRDFERAREAARKADAALSHGEGGALLGVPVTVKESYNVAGLPTTWGFPAFKDYVAQEDALAVKRLKAAGAIVLGKTNVPVALGDWQSYNAIHGTTNNPWDRTRSPGGSSGGSAAALAAGFGPLSLGSDIGGSLRNPAHSCGVCAHKPTFGLVPARGHVPPGLPDLPVVRDLAVVGPMARSVDDLVLLLDIVAGPDEAADGRAYRLGLPPPRAEDAKGFRVLIVADHPLVPTSASVRAAFERFSKALGSAGVDVQYETPLLPDRAASARLYVKLLSAVLTPGMPDSLYQETRAAAESLPAAEQGLGAEFLRGALLSHRDWVQADFARQRLRQQWRELFQHIDVVVCPVGSTPALPHDQSERQADRRIDVDGEAFRYLDQLVWADPATTCGLPATVVPVGVADGLPIGLQIIGPEYEDKTPLAFARLIEQALGGFTPPPDFA